MYGLSFSYQGYKIFAYSIRFLGEGLDIEKKINYKHLKLKESIGITFNLENGLV